MQVKVIMLEGIFYIRKRIKRGLIEGKKIITTPWQLASHGFCWTPDSSQNIFYLG